MGERLSTSEVNAIMKQRDREAERDATIDKLLSNTAGLNTNVKILKQELAKLKAEKENWQELAGHLDDLLACYRTGRRPTEKTLSGIEAARAAIKKAEGE